MSLLVESFNIINPPMIRHDGHFLNRYQRQALLPQIGAAGQARLAGSRLLLVGCGALGCCAADQLVRAGVGWLGVADRDLVELTNLQRQTLFDEADVGMAKAEAAARRLGRINSTVTVEPIVRDVWAGNIDELTEKVDLILDGTDNVQTRYLLNDAAAAKGIRWVHAACVGTEARVLAIGPGSACLRCLYPTPPAGSELPTCDTAGVLQAAAAAAASLQTAQAIKILTGQWKPEDQRLWKLDLWSGRFVAIALQNAARADCPCCGRREFPFLQAGRAESAVSLCGRRAVQIRPAAPWNSADFDRARRRLAECGQLQAERFFFRCRLHDPPGITLTCFQDGRLLVDGAADIGRAKAICARFIGT
jgi:molybdopterin-synthase adenylyltransferase